ncbi:tail assembly protein [Allopusillimonas ginsengisoli]|nr:tail assembly protein [Allopusillimonas ginsengisoli]
MRTIRLYGKLGARFGRVHRFVCRNTAEAVHALCQMVPGFEKFLYESKDHGLGYACFIGRQNISEEGLQYPVGGDDIRIAPMILGSGRGGFFQIILGAALIVAAPYAAAAAWGAGYAGLTAAIATYAPMLGWAMVLGGVSQLLTKQPQGLTSVESPDNGASYNFNGPVNVPAQGNPVPVLYGEAIVGSVTISGDMYSEDIQ